MKYMGCATQCDLASCDNLDSAEECVGDDVFSGCVCETGFALKNGDCVPEAECSSTEWSNWGAWARVTVIFKILLKEIKF